VFLIHFSVFIGVPACSSPVRSWFRLSPVKWCNKSGQRSAAVPDVIFSVTAAAADLLARGGVEKRGAFFQA
jgi:hypothetical protein